MPGSKIETQANSWLTVEDAAARILRYRDLTLGVSGLVAAVLAAATYAITRDANEVYARSLGLTPEEIGASQSVLVAKATLVFLLILALISATTAAYITGRVTAARVVGKISRNSAAIRWLKFRSIQSGRTAASRLCAGLVAFSPLGVSLLPMAAMLVLQEMVNPAILFVASSFAFSFGYEFAAGVSVDIQPLRFRIAKASVVGVACWCVLIASALTWVAVSHLETTARSRAQQLLSYDFNKQTAIVDLFLTGQAKAASIALLDAENDPLGACEQRRVPILIAQTSTDYLVALYPNRRQNAIGIFRLPRDYYSVVTGLSPSRPCELGVVKGL
ncbi:hypothetical protein [Phycicoccus sp. DTK01]|uniref:hypothetical protein n=1 Tax=Phycicoccus sp. DTK01 TaxID=2785745 RepID=UPI001A8D5467|nr:hypothetical protein [Phycicoccus sp. DTK01]GIL36023.1 hypothetical protein PDTK01_20980 [Phycicoccus sp. DTK01]